MLFGRQNNLTRRAVRPDGRTVRDLRRRGQRRASLLELATNSAPPPPSLLSRLLQPLARWMRRR